MNIAHQLYQFYSTSVILAVIKQKLRPKRATVILTNLRKAVAVVGNLIDLFMFDKLFDKIFRRRFHGLEIQKKDAETLFLKIDATTTKQIIDEFLASLPDKYQLIFFDNSYPQISDPGAYVWTQRLIDDKYAYSLHNHGWSSEWKQISKSELVDYIYLNRQFNNDNFKIYPYQKKAELGKIIGKY